MKSVYISFICICYLFAAKINAQEKAIPFIQNDTPKYADTEFITLEEIHKIDVDVFDEYYIYKVRRMDVDSDTNLYVLDFYESTITIFDKNGKYLMTMGRQGQGPNELEQPLSISIYDDKISIYEKFKGIKIWDLNGKYIYSILDSRKNISICKAINNYYLFVLICQGVYTLR